MTGSDLCCSCVKNTESFKTSFHPCNCHLIKNDVKTWQILGPLLRDSSSQNHFCLVHYTSLHLLTRSACRFQLSRMRDKRKVKHHKCGEWCGGVRIRNIFISVNVTCFSQFHLMSCERFSITDERIGDFYHLTVWNRNIFGWYNNPLESIDHFGATCGNFNIVLVKEYLLLLIHNVQNSIICHTKN